MTEPPTEELDRLRAGIDEIDRRVVELLAERARLVKGVAHYKERRRVAVVDRQREDAMLARIAEVAKDAGLDPRIAQQVLRTVIDAFTLLQMEGLAAGSPGEPDDQGAG